MTSVSHSTIAPSTAGEPALAGTDLRIIDIVRHAYEHGLDAGDGLGTPPIGRAVLELAINYCADRACDRDRAWCSGCRLKTEQLGLKTLDDYCAQFAEIAFDDRPAVLRAGGTGTIRFPNLESLARNWQGEEMFFVARRVHRRLHKEREPRPKRLAGPSGLDGPAIILVGAQMADNIGMSARAMANFGLEDLYLVNPSDGWQGGRARAASSGAAYVIDGAKCFPTTAGAIAGLHWTCATTARQRHMTKPMMTPEQAASELLRRIEAGQRVGILFGPERQGLENDDVALADATVMIPVNPRFASLNLAQAVLLMGYEWLKMSNHGTLGRVTTFEAPLEPGLVSKGSPPATKDELLGLFEHLERELDEAGFLKPPDKRTVMIRNIRSMLGRMEATEQEVRTLRGIVAALSYSHKRRSSEP